MSASDILSKDIGGKSKGKYPSKTSINLIYSEHRTESLVRTLVLFGIYLVLLAAFVFFVILPRIAKLSNAEAAYDKLSAQISDMKDKNSDYEQVRSEYSHYGNNYLNSDEEVMQDRMKILALIDKDLMGQDGVQSITVSGNVATLTISSDLLKNVAGIVATLEAEDMVSYVTVSTASSTVKSQNAQSKSDAAVKDITSTMTIYFNNVEAKTAGSAEDAGISSSAAVISSDETGADANAAS